MHSDLLVRRRVLVVSYRRYLDADREWISAVRDAASWFPAEERSTLPMLGDPGSRVRRLYEIRERALQRLLAAREKLQRARSRLSERKRPSRSPKQLFLLAR